MTSMSELCGWQWFMQTSFPMAVAVLSDEEMKPPKHVFFTVIGPLANLNPVMSLSLHMKKKCYE